MARKQAKLPPIHPGEILREDLMKPLEISINRLGRDLRVPVTRIVRSSIADVASVLTRR